MRLTYFSVLFSALDSALVDMVPRFFRPFDTPDDRLAKLTMLMDWSSQNTYENLLVLEQRTTVLEATIALNRSSLLAAMIAEGLIPSANAIEFSDLNLAHRIFIYLPDEIFPVIMEQPDSLHVLLKTVVIAASYAEFSSVVQTACAAVRFKTQQPRLRARWNFANTIGVNTRWSDDMCGHNLSSDFFRSIQLNELYLLMKATASQASPGAIVEMLASTASVDVSLATESRFCPIEVDPFSKVICSEFGDVRACRTLSEMYRGFFARIENFHAKLARLHILVETVVLSIQPADIREAYLTPQFDFVFPIQRSQLLVRVLRLNQLTTPRWPLLERLLNAATVDQVELELKVVVGGGVESFLTAVSFLCLFRGYLAKRCLSDSFVSGISQEALRRLVEENDPQTAAYQYIFPATTVVTPISMMMRKLHRHVKRTEDLPEAVIDCEICGEAFDDANQLKSAVELCAPHHYMCVECADRWLGESTPEKQRHELTCPFCRRVVLKVCDPGKKRHVSALSRISSEFIDTSNHREHSIDFVKIALLFFVIFQLSIILAAYIHISQLS